LAANAGRVPRNAPRCANPDVGPEVVISKRKGARGGAPCS
jgi:hypothetical protein